MNILRRLAAKARFELESIYVLARYPFARDQLTSRLENAIPSLSIELTNICNANCVFCAYQYQKRPQGVMSDSLFDKLIREYDEVGGGALNLTPTVGDPLVDKNILDRIARARARPNITSIGMYSNLISLERVGAANLVNSGLTSLTVSTSGLRKDMYERVYRSKEYERMLRNLFAFAAANVEAGSRVSLYVDMRVDRGAAEVLAYDDCRRLADLIGPERIGVKWRYDSWSGKIRQGELPGNMKLRSPIHVLRPRISPCSELYSGPMVYWNGRVGACGCRDVDASELIIGDANSSHVADIWMSDVLRQLRSEFLTAKVKDICRTCTHYGPITTYLRPDTKHVLDRIRPVAWRQR